MVENKNVTVVEFEREAKYKIGEVTYLVTAHYDDNGETLKDKMKQLLLEKMAKEIAANRY